MDKKNEVLNKLKERDNTTIFAHKHEIADLLFNYATDEVMFTVGRYSEDEEFLMLSKIYNEIIVESIIDFNGDIYYCDATTVIMTKQVLEYVISKNQLERVVDECEDFSVIS